jgi:hypothetical protein
MNVLLACEESQEVCLAFREKGHFAYSCDLQECSGGHPEWHLQMDVFDAFNELDWDLVIAFPPCTHLATSGARWFKEKQRDGRQYQAYKFFIEMASTKFERLAIENPIGIMSKLYRKPDQIVHPWMFGDPYSKATCLWLRGLPLLQPTNIVDKGDYELTNGGNLIPSWYNLPPSEDRAKMRSKTFPGLAKAMADQWSF